MIYDQVAEKAKKELAPHQKQLTEVEQAILSKTEAIKVEDSKKREAEMREELTAIKQTRRQLWGTIAGIEEEMFKNLLAEEYGIPRGKWFDKAYSLAYSHGHSSGFSEVENYFMDFIELVMSKEDIRVLNFIADRLVSVHKENPNTDYILRLRKIAEGDKI